MHTYKVFKNHFLYIVFLLGLALVLRFGAVIFLIKEYNVWIRLAAVAVILWVGSAYVLTGIAHIIEETTEVLSKRTKLAGGFLQSFGTAIPDMALGVAAAILSLRFKGTNFSMAVNYAIIAAATTFGSNIYNIGHASWCIFRQNLANKLGRNVMMVPGTDKGGVLQPMSNHKRRPNMAEIDTAIDVSTALTVLTACVALGMVIFGRVNQPVEGIVGDLYQLARPIGITVAVLCITLLYFFRGTKRAESPDEDIIEGEQYYRTQKSLTIWIHLFISAGAILLTAEAMVRGVEVFAEISGMPFVVAGILAGCMGCLEEMIVVHNFSVHPNGRIGDAVVGVAMDNIITILGASVIAIMGGIFLGGNALILIFVIILTLNSILVWQISRLKNYFCTMGK